MVDMLRAGSTHSGRISAVGVRKQGAESTFSPARTSSQCDAAAAARAKSEKGVRFTFCASRHSLEGHGHGDQSRRARVSSLANSGSCG